MDACDVDVQHVLEAGVLGKRHGRLYDGRFAGWPRWWLRCPLRCRRPWACPSHTSASSVRATREDGLRWLVDARVPQEHLDRRRTLIGPNIGGLSVQAMAISMLAEIIAAHSGGTGAPLSSVTSPIQP